MYIMYFYLLFHICAYVYIYIYICAHVCIYITLIRPIRLDEIITLIPVLNEKNFFYVNLSVNNCQICCVRDILYW